MRIFYVGLSVTIFFLLQIGKGEAAIDHQQWMDYSLESIGGTLDSAPSSNLNAHRLRNLRITQAYSDMYLSRPEAFKWAGLAASISKEIGIRLAQAASSNSFSAHIVFEIAKKAGWLSPNLDPELLGSTIGHFLGSGNYFVFKDLYWQHLVARQCGIDDLLLYSLPPLVLDGWKEINLGIIEEDQAKVWAGNKKLLEYEQSVTLQTHVYNADRALWKQLTEIDRNTVTLFKSPSGISFSDVNPNGDFGVFADRWKWIESAVFGPAQSVDLLASADSAFGPGRGRSMVDEVQKTLAKVSGEINRLESIEPALKLKAIQMPACATSAPNPPTNLQVR